MGRKRSRWEREREWVKKRNRRFRNGHYLPRRPKPKPKEEQE